MGAGTTIYDIQVNLVGRSGDAGAALDSVSMKAKKAANDVKMLKAALFSRNRAERHAFDNQMDLVSNSARRATQGTNIFSSALLRLGGIITGTVALYKAKELFIDYNMEIEKLKIGLSSVFQMNLGGTFEEAQQKAHGLFEEFQRFAVQTPLTTRELTSFGQEISGAFFTYSSSMEQFKDFAERGAIAAQVLNMPAEWASIQMQEMMAGATMKRQRFSVQLLGPTLKKHGMDLEAFNKSDPVKRFQLINEALFNPGLLAASKQYEASFIGRWSTLVDKIEILASGAAKPLFAMLTDQFKAWNSWLDKNPMKVASFLKDVSTLLVDAFRYIKGIVGFVVEHKDLIKAAILAYLPGKLIEQVDIFGNGGGRGGTGGIVSGMLGGAVVGGATGDWGSKASLIGGGILGMAASMPGPLGMFSGAILAFKNACDVFANSVLAEQKEKIERESQSAGILNLIDKEKNLSLPYTKDENVQDRFDRGEKRGLDIALIRYAKELGVTNEFASMDFAKYRQELLNQNLAAETVDLVVARTFEAFANTPFWLRHLKIIGGEMFGPKDETEEQKKEREKLAGKGDIKINIHKIEVASDDPDRFVFGLVKSFDEVVRNPSQAHATMQGSL